MLVLVHGLSASSRWWRALRPLLGGHEAVALDIPRYGRAFRPAETVDWLTARLEESAPVDLIGHSLGGLVCARLAAERPGLVRRLALVAPVGAPAGTGRLRAVAALGRTALSAPPALLGAMVADAVRWGPGALLRGGLFATREAFAGEIRAPTLLVWGDRDRLVPLELADAWRELIPDARLAVVPGAGHAPMIEAPSAFAQLLLEFLDEPGDDAGMRPVDGVAASGDDDQPGGPGG